MNRRDGDDDDDDTRQTQRTSGRTALNLLVGNSDDDYDACACERFECVRVSRRGCATRAKGFRARGLRTRSSVAVDHTRAGQWLGVTLAME